MRISRAARVALLLLAASSALIVGPRRAAASCAFDPRALREQVDDAEAVIVGTVTEAGVVDSRARKNELGRPLRWTIEVERDVKGNVGDTLSFHAGRSGGGFASSQFGASRGERVGLLLSRRDGEFSVSACDKRDPGSLLTAAEPLPPPRARGAPLLLASGGFGSPRVALLDERGRIARFGDGRGDAAIGVCPDERFVAEAISDRTGLSEDGAPTTVEIRDLQTMRVTRRHRLPPGITTRIRERPFAIACRNAEATDVLVAAEAGSYSARVLRLRDDGWSTVYDAKARAVMFLPKGFAVLWHSGRDFELAIHHPDGTVSRRLGPLPSFKHLSISEPVRLAADASGRYVAGASEEPTDDIENLFVGDLETGKLKRARVPWVAGLAWAGNDLVLGPLYGRDGDGYVDEDGEGEVRVYGPNLVRKARWRRWTGHQTVVLGERLYGVRRGSRADDGSLADTAIVSAPYRAGPERVENTITDVTIDQLVAMDEGPPVDRSPKATWTVLGLLAFLLALAVIVVRSRLRPSTEPQGPPRTLS